jgi:crotonobetainyl-CoA:carnitine CoA-transferase CaiB-like acyl-CoA transferase
MPRSAAWRERAVRRPVPEMPGTARAIDAIWREASLPEDSLRHLRLSGVDPVLPSSFAVGTAAQATLAAAALAGAEVGYVRNGLRQTIDVDMRHAALECVGRFTIDGRTPDPWDKIAGLYRCGPEGADGWVRLHTNFAHHRDGVLQLLGLPTGPDTLREAVAAALRQWRALDFEDAAARAGLVVAALRRFDEWDRHPQAAAIAQTPLVAIDKIAEADPIIWPDLPPGARPLHGLRVLDLTRILAGPVGGRTLAAYGADVMLVNAPHLPNIESIIDTSRGKLSALADLRDPAGRSGLNAVLRDAHVLAQGYRPGALGALGYAPAEVAALRPGIVMVSLSAYGDSGPWAGRRGFDSLVQTATGLNHAEAQAAGASSPRALPMQILDMATGFLMAFGAQAALLRQRREGGSWHVRVSLARTALWLRELGRVKDGFGVPTPDFTGLMETQVSGYGELVAMRHAAGFSHTPAGWARPSMPPGSHPLAWPTR